MGPFQWEPEEREAVSADSPGAAVGVVRQHLVPGSETFIRAESHQGQFAPGQENVLADRACLCGA